MSNNINVALSWTHTPEPYDEPFEWSADAERDRAEIHQHNESNYPGLVYHGMSICGRSSAHDPFMRWRADSEAACKTLGHLRAKDSSTCLRCQSVQYRWSIEAAAEDMAARIESDIVEQLWRSK